MKLRSLALLLVLLIAGGVAFSQTQPSGPPPNQSAAKAEPAPADELSPSTAKELQSRAEAFLRNLYAWGPEFEVTPGEVKPSPIPGLYEINVEVSLQGRSDSAAVYVTKDGHYMVRGEISDMTVDPYAEAKQKLALDGAPSKGPLDAAVVIVEFGDFQCPSCRALEMVLRKVLPDYPLVRFVFKDFPLEQIHPWAMTAALVGQCSYQQSPDAFWKFHDLIYDSQDQVMPDTAYDKLLQLGAEAGANPEALRACVADPKTTESVRQSIAEGRSVGVEGTPTTFVNGRPVIGPNEQLLRQFIHFSR